MGGGRIILRSLTYFLVILHSSLSRGETVCILPPDKMDLLLVVLLGLHSISASVIYNPKELSSSASILGPPPASYMRANNNGNYTVSFVPLISIIANFLPRFFNRYGTSGPTTVQQARMLDLAYKAEPQKNCQHPVHAGLKWPDPESSSHFYICELQDSCFKLNQVPCYLIKHKSCPYRAVFSSQQQLCLHYDLQRSVTYS